MRLEGAHQSKGREEEVVPRDEAHRGAPGSMWTGAGEAEKGPRDGEVDGDGTVSLELPRAGRGDDGEEGIAQIPFPLKTRARR